MLYAVFYTSLLELDIQLINFYASITFNVETSSLCWMLLTLADGLFSFPFSNVLFPYVHPYRFCVLVSTWRFLLMHISILNSQGVVNSEKAVTQRIS